MVAAFANGKTASAGNTVPPLRWLRALHAAWRGVPGVLIEIGAGIAIFRHACTNEIRGGRLGDR